MLRPILTAALLLSTCSAASAGTVYSGLDGGPSPIYHESRAVAEILVNGVPKTQHAFDVEAMYQAEVLGPIIQNVGFRTDPTRPHDWPTLRLHTGLPLWLAETPGGTTVTARFIAIGGFPTYASRTGELPDEIAVALEFIRGSQEDESSVRFSPTFDDPMTAGVPVLLDIDPANLLELPNIVGPWHNDDVTLFDGTMFGEELTIVLDRFGFENRSIGTQHVVLGVPEPANWYILVPAVIAGWFMIRACQRQWPGQRG